MPRQVGRAAFEQMVERMAREIPAEYFDGITEVTVSPRVVPSPGRDEVFTLGECIPLPLATGDGGADVVQSRIVLYHGSFAALADIDDTFDWEQEAWDTLTHEVRHHVEWRARRDDLEHYDRAADANNARLEGAPFDPAFYLDGEPLDDGVFRVDDDVFVDRVVTGVPGQVAFRWGGIGYAGVPVGVGSVPAYLVVEGVAEPPDGDLIVSLRRKARLRDLLVPPALQHGTVTVRRTDP